MVIAPNSTIILFSGMPLDDTYSDTLWFQTKSNRDGFFTNVNNPYKKMVLEQNTYQRVNSGVFEAKVLADEIYDVNYMAFQNTNFGNKWFYAFVTSVEYINNLNTRVSYVIDVIQTYLFDCTFEACLVEREHSANDTLFENFLPEPVALAEYEFDFYGDINKKLDTNPDLYLNDVDIVVQYVETDGRSSEGYLIGNTYVGTHYRVYRATQAGASALASWLGNSSNIQKPDQILNMYMAPRYITRGTDEGRVISGSESVTMRTVDWTLPNTLYTLLFGQIGGYSVRNKKLFTYPFSYLHIDDANCHSMALRFEFFDDIVNNNINLRIYGSPIAPIQQSIFPLGYKGIHMSATVEELFTEKLTLSEYPLCSWNYDTYKAWQAQNTVPMVLKGAGAVVDIGVGVANLASTDLSGGDSMEYGLSKGIHGLIDIGTEWYKASIQADTVRGSIANGNALFSNGKLNFNWGRAHQPVEYLAVIDDFFDMYGYTTNRVKIPNISSRPHWNYVKTRESKVIGKCPTDSLKKLCAIFDHGITFWKNASEVGNYSLDNRPQNNG